MELLLVEDNGADAYLFKDLLTSREDAPVLHWVTDGAEALDYLTRRGRYLDAPRPDVVLLDLSLPRVNGYSVLRQLKQSPALAGIPVFVFTTSLSESDRQECSLLGASLFISKPENLRGYETLIDRLVSGDYEPYKIPAASAAAH